MYDFRTIFILISYLQKNNIPHNIYITRALNKELSSSDLDDIRNCLRVFIWARTPSGELLIIHSLNLKLLFYKLLVTVTFKTTIFS